jgi:NTP pyrophosphatase (non-canonical NTP hydrolase)
MTTKEYQQSVKRTVNPSLTLKDAIIQKVFGIAGEAGEVVDIFKKHFFQEHAVNKDRVKEEIGDMMWYIAGLCNLLDIDISEIYDLNIEKLKRRYPEGFDRNKSIWRTV